MKCASCQHENESSDKFCSECGSSLVAKCASCGAALKPGAKFCSGCGSSTVSTAHEFAAGPPARRVADYTPSHLADRIRAQQQVMESRGVQDGERKTITVLFADLKGSTALLEGLDPEVARSVIDPALQIMMDAVHRYEGYVAQALGDGILALFGAPLAHEDHAQRAVFAALRMQEEMKRHSDVVRLKHGAPLAIRVGLNTGEVVVRSIRKDDLHTDYVPVGHSINLAARMEQMATPGSILITAYTQKLVDGYFALKPLGEAAIKGMEQPLSVFEVTGAGTLRTRLQIAARRGLTRFVGRRHEVDQLQRALDDVRAGRGQVVCIMGEPGMGKSRLVHEFKRNAPGFAVFEAYSASHGKASPYLPITELLKGYFQIQPADDERTRREKIIGKLLGLDRSLEEVLPYYFALLNVEDSDSPLPQMDPQLRRRRTFEALKKVTLRASLEQPVLLIFEDLHWIDGETQGFLDGLVESLGSARILLLTNFRPEYRHEWGSKTYCAQLRLASFGHGEAEEFLDLLLGAPADTTTALRMHGLKQWILEKSDGTPFFMEEVVQELFERQHLQRDLEGRLLLPPHASPPLQLPTTIQGVLAARIDRLSTEEKSLLQQLSVIGRAFPSSLMTTVVALPEPVLLPCLNALQRKEFLYEQPAFPEVEYLFKHALTQEVAYGSLLHETRKGIHEKTARAIEASYPNELEDHYQALAHHYGRSDNPAKAVEYLEKAGLQAIRRAASGDAVTYLRGALTRLAEIRGDGDTDQRELRLLIALVGPLRMTEGMATPAVEQASLRILALSERIGDIGHLFNALSDLRNFHSFRGDQRAAMPYAERMLLIAAQEQNDVFAIYGHVEMEVCLAYLGRLSAALEHCAAARALYDPARDEHYLSVFAYNPYVIATIIEAQVRWIAGYPDQAVACSNDALVVARESSHPWLIACALLWGALVRIYRHELAECRSLAESAREIASEQGFSDWLAISEIVDGWSQVAACDARGVHVLRGGLARYVAIQAGLGLPLFHALSAHCHLALNEPDAALGAVEQGIAVAERNDEALYLPELHRLRGEILLRSRDAGADADARAEACFVQAIELARRQSAKSWELRATLSLARLWQRQEKQGEACKLLSEIYGWFTEGFDTRDLIESKTLLEGLASVR